MSTILRIILILASCLALYTVIRKIRKAGMGIDDAIFWVIASLVLILISIFPQIIYRISDLVGTQSPANLIYLVIIAVLLYKVFSLSVEISRLEARITGLAQAMALDKKESPDEEKKEDRS